MVLHFHQYIGPGPLSQAHISMISWSPGVSPTILCLLFVLAAKHFIILQGFRANHLDLGCLNPALRMLYTLYLPMIPLFICWEEGWVPEILGSDLVCCFEEAHISVTHSTSPGHSASSSLHHTWRSLHHQKIQHFLLGDQGCNFSHLRSGTPFYQSSNGINLI